MSIHMSASFPQTVQVAVPLTRWGGAEDACSEAGDSFSGNAQVISISASLPQFLHLQTRFASSSLIGLLLAARAGPPCPAVNVSVLVMNYVLD